MSRLHLVFGGRVKNPQGLDFDLFDGYCKARGCTSDEARRK